MRVVIDTNVLISRFLSPTGIPAKLMHMWQHHAAFNVVVSQVVLQEYEAALTYPHIQARHRLTKEEIMTFLTLFSQLALLVAPREDLPVLARDPDDTIFLATALAGNAEYLVSGDRDLLEIRTYQGIRVLTPTTFLALLEHKQKAA